MPVITFDFSRRLNKKLAASLQKRLDRLKTMRDTEAVDQARAAFQNVAPAGRSHLGDSLLIRPGFVFRTTPAPAGSDRKAPPREERPPATRVANSRGLALRLELTALAAAQSRYRAGATFRNDLPLKPSTTSSADGWIDLLATPTRRSGSGRVSTGVLDKKLRQVQTALGTLADAGLVELPNVDKPTGTYEQFELLNEGGRRSTGPPLPYQVPRGTEWVTKLPSGLITSGWIHVLEDSELNLLLMVAARLGNLPNQGDRVAIPADTRLLHYGISRHAFGDAHVVLALLGLLDVKEVGRHEGGQAIEYEQEGADLHQLMIISDGFAQVALPTAIEKIQAALARVS